jgi:hypothetical protein
MRIICQHSHTYIILLLVCDIHFGIVDAGLLNHAICISILIDISLLNDTTATYCFGTS